MRSIKLSELIQDAGNLNRGTDAGRELVSESIGKLGAGRSVLVDRQGRIIAGNKTVSGAIQAGLTEALIIETNGEQVVVVKRTDLDLESDLKARELSFADNRASEIGLEWDTKGISEMLDKVDNPLDMIGIDEKFLEDLGIVDESQVVDNPEEEWQGMPEYDNEDKTAQQQIIINFKSFDDVQKFSELMGQKITEKTKSLWYPEAEIEHCMDKKYE